MKKLALLLFLISSTLVAQIHTEVDLFDISEKDGKWQLTSGKNISNDIGYDSQPHFYDDNTILFSSTINEQTDVLKYNTETEEKTFNEIHRIYIDSLEFKSEFLLSKNSKDQTGFETFISTKGFSEGKHTVKFKKRVIKNKDTFFLQK